MEFEFKSRPHLREIIDELRDLFVYCDNEEAERLASALVDCQNAGTTLHISF
jgi:hypothetical protein